MRYLIGMAFGLLMMGAAHSDVPDVTGIVDAHQAFSEAPSATTRTQLMNALAAYDGDPAIETVSAYLEIVAIDSQTGNHPNIRESSLATIAHLEPIASVLPQQYYEAKYVAAIAYFNGEQNPNAMLEMAQVKGFSTQLYDEAGEKPEWAETLRWRADAWGLAMEAYFASERIRYPSDADIEAVLASYGLDENSKNEMARTTPGESSGLPHCEGKLIQRPKMRYPSGDARRGMFGAVILRFGFDAEGQVVDPEILASVPRNTFEEKTLTTVKKWRYKPDKAREVGKTCALDRTNVVLPFTFQLN